MNKFTTTNYDADSELTEADKADLKTLYTMAWNGTLQQINGTPIRFVKPFHTIAGDPATAVAEANPFAPASITSTATQVGQVLASTQQLLKVASELLLAGGPAKT